MQAFHLEGLPGEWSVLPMTRGCEMRRSGLEVNGHSRVALWVDSSHVKVRPIASSVVTISEAVTEIS